MNDDDDTKNLNSSEVVEEAGNLDSSQNYEELVQELSKELENTKKSLLIALADCQNIKKRADKEKDELLSFAQTNLLLKLIDFYEDFIKLTNHFKDNSDTVDQMNPLLDKLKNIIVTEGVEIVEVAKGDTFNPQYHQAIGFIETQKEEERNKIAEVISRGYLKSTTKQIILSAKVIVYR